MWNQCQLGLLSWVCFICSRTVTDNYSGICDTFCLIGNLVTARKKWLFSYFSLMFRLLTLILRTDLWDIVDIKCDSVIRKFGSKLLCKSNHALWLERWLRGSSIYCSFRGTVQFLPSTPHCSQAPITPASEEVQHPFLAYGDTCTHRLLLQCIHK